MRAWPALLLLVSCTQGFDWELGSGWERRPIVNGWEYVSPETTLTLRVFDDEHMDQAVLFSRQTRNNIRSNYEETYRVEEDHVYFTERTIAGRPALVVFFADRSTGTLVHRRQYYVVDGHRVYLLAGVVGPLSTAELDALASRFTLR